MVTCRLGTYGWKRQRGFAVIASIVFLVVLLLIGSIMVEQSIQELNTASKVKKDTQAFQVAEAGIDYAAWKAYNLGQSNLALPITWTRSDLPGGSFSVIATQYNGTNETIVLTSTGTAAGHQAVVKVVGAFLPTTLQHQNTVFDHALFSNSDLRLGGNANIHGSVHANGAITVNGNPTVTGNVSASGRAASSSNFQGTVRSNQPRVAMPTVDLTYYRNHATTIFASGKSFSGNTALTGIVFVEGSCSINANFSGKCTIVATGQITVNGNATVQNPATDEIAIISAKGVKINGNCTIQGWVYAHSVTLDAAFDGNGTATIIGGVAADVISKANGTLNVTYKIPTVELPGGQFSPSQIDAVSWRRVR